MDNHSFATLLRNEPNEVLLRAVAEGKAHKDVLPLLEVELQRSAYRLQRLKEYRNELASPMYRLQPELLASIMSIYARDNNELYNLRWTKLVFVCRRWLDIAMRTLELWSFIEVDSGRVMDPYVPEIAKARDIRRIETQRSRAVRSPLSIKIFANVDFEKGKLAYISMFWHPSSLSSLILDARAEYVETIVRILAAHRHDILKRLEVHCGVSNASTLAAMRPSLDVAFKDNMPQLSRLAIDLTFEWALMRGLRSLRVLYDLYLDDKAAALTFTLRDICDALTRCPLLEDLEIRLPQTYMRGTMSSCAPLSLPRLETAFFRANLDVCNELLAMLSASPSSAKLHARAIGTSEDPSTLSAIPNHLGTHARHEEAPVIRSLVMTRQSIMLHHGAAPMPRLGVVARTSPKRLHDRTRSLLSVWSAEEAYTTSSHIGFELTLPDTATESRILKDTINSWPLLHVTHLDLRRVTESSQDYLSVILAGFPVVTLIVIRPESPTARDLIETLRSQLREHGRRALAHIAFDAAFVRDHRQPNVQWSASAQETLMRTMLYCREAASAGAAVDTIEVYNTSRDPRHHFMGPVDDLDWSELYSDLRYGFVYEGVLHSGKPEYDGAEWDSFADDDSIRR